MQLFGFSGVRAAFAQVNEYDVEADHRLLMRLFMANSIVSNSPWPSTFVTRLTVGSPTRDEVRLNAWIGAPSSVLPTTPSGPGSRTVVSTLKASYGWFVLMVPVRCFSTRRT